MPRTKDKTNSLNLVKCPYCNLAYKNLTQHLQTNKRCRNDVFANDPTKLFYISNHDSIQPKSSSTSMQIPPRDEEQSSISTLKQNSLAGNSLSLNRNRYGNDNNETQDISNHTASSSHHVATSMNTEILHQESYFFDNNLFQINQRNRCSSNSQKKSNKNATAKSSASNCIHHPQIFMLPTSESQLSRASSPNPPQFNNYEMVCNDNHNIHTSTSTKAYTSESEENNDEEFDMNDDPDDFNIFQEDNNVTQVDTYTTEQINNMPSPPYQQLQQNNILNNLPSNNTETTVYVPPIPETNPLNFNHLYADFRKYQLNILVLQHNELPVSKEIIQCIRLLQIIVDSKLPKSVYTSTIKWHQQTLSKLYFQKLNVLQETIQIPILPKSYSNVIETINDILSVGDKTVELKPECHQVVIPSEHTISVTRFPLKAMLYSLFLTPSLMDSKHCLLHNKYYRNPNLLRDLDTKDRVFGDIHTGEWFFNAYNNICTSQRDVLVPIIIFCDETPIDTYGRLGLDAILFTLGCFKKDVRNLDKAWRLLGYVPDMKNYTSDGSSKSKQRNIRKDYHSVLTVILQEIYELERSGGIAYTIQSDCGTKFEDVTLRFCLMLVSGDAPGLDKLADMYCSYTTASKYVCRDCYCLSSNLNNHLEKCIFVNRADITNKSKEELEEYCYHKVENNAFNRHSFGGDPSHINGCSPPEILHQFLLGVVKMLLKYFSGAITNKAMQQIDRTVIFISRNFSRQSHRKFPDIALFKNGYVKSHLTGKEHINQLFILYISLIQTYNMYTIPIIDSKSAAKSCTVKKQKTSTTSTGRSRNHFNGKSTVTEFVEEKVEYNKILSDLTKMRKWINLLEQTLCFNQWLQQSEIPYTDLIDTTSEDHSDDIHPDLSEESGAPFHYTSIADKAIRKFMSNFTENVKEMAGNKTCTAKLHWILHLEHYAKKFGAFVNYEGGIGERMLKSMVKQPARQTQRRQHVLAYQACTRYYEHILVKTINNLLDYSPPENTEKNTQNNPTALSCDQNTLEFTDTSKRRSYSTIGIYHLITEEDNMNLLEKIKYPKDPQRGKNQMVTHNIELLQRIIVRLRMDDFKFVGSEIHCFTTLKFCMDWSSNNINENIKDPQDVLFRADPCYHGKPWLDWCLTSWTSDNVEDYDDEELNDDPENIAYYPARIIMFIDPRQMDFTDKDDLLKRKGKLWAIINCTKADVRSSSPNTLPTKRKFNDKCRLIKTFEVEDEYRIISVNAIERDAFVVCDSNSENLSSWNHSADAKASNQTHSSTYVMLLEDIEHWPSMFINTNNWKM